VTRFAISLLICGAVWGQDASRVAPDPAQPQPAQGRILWIIPNHRTVPSTGPYHPLTTKEKFHLAQKEALDPGTFVLAGLLAGQGQWSNTNPSFGQGAAGYGRRYGTSYADLAIGDYMTTAIFPSLLHQDPRYFRKGSGSAYSRIGHAVTQIFWTRMDSGKYNVNYSELGGNAVAAGIANAYYPDRRTASDTAQRFGVQIALDVAGNVMKEFWPDLQGKLPGHKKNSASRKP
jgi:hypothetical protein